MLKKGLKIIGIILGSVVTIIGVTLLFQYIQSTITATKHEKLLGEETSSIIVDGITFRDLNKNGTLDPYEDYRKSISERVADLLGQMTLEEKAGSMFITMAGMTSEGGLSNKKTIFNPISLVLPANMTLVAKKKLHHFNILQAPSPEALVNWNNNIQKLAERTRLGIPVTIATDPRHGAPHAPGMSISTPFFSKWCSPTGFGAIGDTVLMRTFGEIASQEYKAVGLRLALSPQADLATEPRVARINGMFSEDAQLTAALTKAYIKGFQGDSLTSESVSCVVKHFTGYGPQEDGLDPHFPPGIQVYPGNNHNYHLIPFEAAFEAKVAQVMPSYSIPEKITKERVVFGYNREIVTGLLRNKYKFDGIVVTDYGIVTDMKLFGLVLKPASAYGAEHLSVPERVAKILHAGCDMIGGDYIPEVIVDLVKEGIVSEERINSSVTRILKEKFTLGLFDNPYLGMEGLKILANETFQAKGLESQRRSLVLLKNENILPLKKGTSIHPIGFYEEEIERFGQVITDLEDAEVIVLKLTTPHESLGEYFIERFLPQGRLDFTEEEKARLLGIINSKPTVTVINLERPAVFPAINAASKAVIADFASQDDVILDLIYGEFSPEGKLPFELPSSMEAVKAQLEDVPYDSKAPLYPFGFGLSY
ncbi:MAG: glycoside hydrolase family 3 N-terminal domain-containing protein [Bacteroidota bacterium]